MALLRATLLLFRTHVGRLLLSKRTLLCALLALGPAALALLIMGVGQEPPPAQEVFMYPSWYLMFLIIVPLVSLISGSAVIAEEIDDRTITYLFTRPFPRAALLLGRWLATVVVLCLILGGGSLLHAKVCQGLAPTPEDASFSDGIVAPVVSMVMLGGAVYSALFAVIGTFLKRPMIVGLGYAFVMEGFLANLPGKTQGLTILYRLRSYIAQSSSEWDDVHDLGTQWLEPQSSSLTTLAVILIVALAVGSRVISRRQYVLTS